jgi:hypothetical protein
LTDDGLIGVIALAAARTALLDAVLQSFDPRHAIGPARRATARRAPDGAASRSRGAAGASNREHQRRRTGEGDRHRARDQRYGDTDHPALDGRDQRPPTSFTPFGPSFAGSSTSPPTVGGTYSGADGTDTLTFRVLAGGFVGTPILPLRLGVFNGQGTQIDTLTFTNLPANTPVTATNPTFRNLTGRFLRISRTAVAGSRWSQVGPYW